MWVTKELQVSMKLCASLGECACAGESASVLLMMCVIQDIRMLVRVPLFYYDMCVC